jgi:hypothetical protein
MFSLSREDLTCRITASHGKQVMVHRRHAFAFLPSELRYREKSKLQRNDRLRRTSSPKIGKPLASSAKLVGSGVPTTLQRGDG